MQRVPICSTAWDGLRHGFQVTVGSANGRDIACVADRAMIAFAPNSIESWTLTRSRSSGPEKSASRQEAQKGVDNNRTDQAKSKQFRQCVRANELQQIWNPLGSRDRDGCPGHH